MSDYKHPVFFSPHRQQTLVSYGIVSALRSIDEAAKLRNKHQY